MVEQAGGNSFDNQSSATSAATGGQIKNGMIWNTSGVGGTGIVKLLTYAAIGLLLWRILRSK